jgi:hypothetical protein
MEIIEFLLTVLSGIGTVVMARNIYMAHVSSRWMVCRATVLEIQSEEHSDSDFMTCYHPSIRYKYVFEGKIYHGDRYEFGKTLYSKKELNHILNEFSIGDEIDIRVNSKKPKISVIKTGTILEHYVALAGILFLFIIILSWY